MYNIYIYITVYTSRFVIKPTLGKGKGKWQRQADRQVVCQTHSSSDTEFHQSCTNRSKFHQHRVLRMRGERVGTLNPKP